MILSSPWVIPISSAVIEDGAVVVEGDRIIDLGSRKAISQRYPHHPVKHFPSSVLLPGFVNVHSHLELSILRGYLEGLSFWKWIRELTRTKYEILTYDDILVSALLGAVEAIQAGITTVGDPMDLGGSLEAVLITGIRGVLYQEVFSPRPEDASSAMKRLEANLQKRQAQIGQFSVSSPLSRFIVLDSLSQERTVAERKRRLRLGVSPHAPYTVSAPLFLAVHQYAKMAGLPVCIHIGESIAERQFLQDGTGPISDSYRARSISWTPPRATPVQYLHRLGVIEELTLLVHCIQLEEEDYEIIRTQKAAVAHCPKSNWKLGHGYMNLNEMQRRSIPLGLGTDSVASNNSMDFFEEMRFTRSNPTVCRHPGNEEFQLEGACQPSSADLLRMSTLGGAEALGLSNEIGSLKAGKLADIIAVNLTGFHVQPVFSPADALVFSCRASDVRMTMVGGEVLFENGVYPGFKPNEFLDAVEQVKTKMLNARRKN
jgi:cytosine/adenosine deaminase-related metal-dependent hydrolase